MLFHTQKLGYFTKIVDLNFLLKNQIIWQQRPRVGVCVCVCVGVCVCARSVVLTSLRLHGLYPGSSAHELFQARIQERAAISHFRGSSQYRN